MITRQAEKEVLYSLKHFPAVAILGARQVGKTTLAKDVAKQLKKPIVYLDLENPADVARLHDAQSFLDQQRDKLVIIDEVQHQPELFALLRWLIDQQRRPGRFLLLGSASPHVRKGVTESLAGRLNYIQLPPVNVLEALPKYSMRQHWFRGGFPSALTARNQQVFKQWMDTFIQTSIERDLSWLFDVNFSVTTMRNFWSMLAHLNGAIWNAQMVSRSLGVTSPTVSRYLDHLEGAYFINRLPAFYVNAKKRLIKAPKIYFVDSGMLHRLSRIHHPDELHGHPVIGSSWEGYVIEQIRRLRHRDLDLYYYRTQDGAECDVVLVKGIKPVACIEIKLSVSAPLSKGFYTSMNDLKTKQNFLITPESDPWRSKEGVVNTGLIPFLEHYLVKLR